MPEPEDHNHDGSNGARPDHVIVHAMEHPVDTTFVPPLVDDRSVQNFKTAILAIAAGRTDGVAVRSQLERYLARLASLNQLAALCRFAAVGGQQAVARLRDEFDCLDHVAPRENHRHDDSGDAHQHATRPDHHHDPLTKSMGAVNLAAVFDLLGGVSLISIGVSERVARYVDVLVRVVEYGMSYAVAFADEAAVVAGSKGRGVGQAHAAAVMDRVATRLASGDDGCAPSIPAQIAHRLRDLAQRWTKRDPVSSLFGLLMPPSPILAVTPSQATTGTLVSIQLGSLINASDYQVMFCPHQPANVVKSTPHSVDVTVPAGARSGPVAVVRKPTQALYESARSAQDEYSSDFPIEWSLSIFGVVPLERWSYLPSMPNAAVIDIVTEPQISAVTSDSLGRWLDASEVELGAVVTIRCDELTGAGAHPKVEAAFGEMVSLTGGTIQYRPKESGPLKITVGEISKTILFVVHPPWQVFPEEYLVPLDGTPGVMTIQLSAPAREPIDFQVDVTGDHVEAPKSVQVPKGESSVDIPIKLARRAKNLTTTKIADKILVSRGNKRRLLGGSVSIPNGLWEAPLENALAIVGVHAVVLHTGKVLYFGFDVRAVNSENGFRQFFADPNAGSYQIWDPVTGSASRVQTTGRNLFCAGHSALADGTIFVAGGQDGAGAADATGKFDDLFAAWFGSDNGAHKDVHTYDPVSDSWTRWPDMEEGRYYPTVQTLPDGSAFISAGLSNLQQFVLSGSVWSQNDQYEIYPAGAFGLGASIRARFDSVDQYPIVRLLPGTRHLFVHKHRTTRIFNLDTGTFIPDAVSLPPEPVGRQTYPMQTGYVILPQLEGEAPRVLIVGGSTARDFDYNTQSDKPAVQGGFIFEYDLQEPTNSRWRSTVGVPLHARLLSDSVLLPDGTVFIVSGVSMGAAAGHSSRFVLETEIFDPLTEQFTAAGALDVRHPRGYHATAVLLPDGRVAVAGSTKAYNTSNGGETTPFDDTSIQIFSPPYLFRGPRPTLSGVPLEARYSSVLTISFDSVTPIEKVILMRPCAVTHSQDTDQRAIWLRAQRSLSSITVSLPADRSLAPPGYYMIFGLTVDGVPSLASWIRIGDDIPTRSGPPSPAELDVHYPPVFLGKYTEHAKVGPVVYDGDVTIEKIDQHCNVEIESRFGSIFILEKIDQHCWVKLSARNTVSVGQQINGVCTVEMTAGNMVFIGQKIDQHCTVAIRAGGVVSIGEKVDQHCRVTINAGGAVSIGQKIDQHCEVVINAVGMVAISQKIDGNSIVTVNTEDSIHIGQKIDGGSVATMVAGGTIAIVEQVGGGAQLNWRAERLTCPNTSEGVIRRMP